MSGSVVLGTMARRLGREPEEVTMDFGVFVATKIDDWQLIRFVEERGYRRAWVPDSQIIWSDCYATLAFAVL